MVFAATGKDAIGVAPNGWVWEILSQHTATDPFLFDQYDYKIWTSQKSKDAGDEFYIWNNNKDQIRENHQRIVKGTAKGPLWQPDKTQPPVEITDFAEFERSGQAIKYKAETVDSKLEWEALDGKKLVPFVFPTYDGVDEPLDPQWVREPHIVSLENQREQHILEYIARAEKDGRSGDLRGSTLNLTISATGNDGVWSSGVFFATTNLNISIGQPVFVNNGFFRYTGTDALAGATITAAVMSYYAEYGSQFNFNTKIWADKQAGPAAPANDGDAEGRTLTTAGTDWDASSETASAYNASPDATAVIQEIATAYTPTAIQILLRDDGSASGKNMNATDYSSDSAKATKLSIDYTGGGGGGATVKTLAALGVG